MDQMSVYLPGIILAYTTFLLAIASPGPNVLAIIGTSMSVGRKSGIALALGVAAGSFCWATLAAILSIIIHWVYAVAFSTRVMVRAYSRARRWIQGALGAVFALAGIKLLTSRT